MSQKYGNYLLFFVFLALAQVISATPTPNWYDTAPSTPWYEDDPQGVVGQRVLVGFRGLNGVPQPPRASGGGELGAVLYITDTIDLAKFFSHGADPTKNYVCFVTVDGAAWATQPKTWVPPRIIAAGANAVNAAYPGAVIFASHTVAPLPAGHGPVYQMGIRQAQIARLGVQTDCRPEATFANDHTFLNYPGLNVQWGIQTPALPFREIEDWMEMAGLPWY